MSSSRSALAAILARPIAHRGLHRREAGCVENTRSAFAAAIAEGFGIECDVQASGDGEAMVFHDFTLDRLTKDSGRLDAQPAAALKQLAFQAGADHIDTLSALLAQVAGRAALIVEVKSGFNRDTRITQRIAAVVADYPGPLALKSFDPAMIIALRGHGVRHPLGIVAMAPERYNEGEFLHLASDARHALGNLLHFNESRPDFLSWNHKDLPAAAPFLCRTVLDLPVMSWTIRSIEDAARVRPHADQIVFEGFVPA